MTSHTPHTDTTPSRQIALTERHAMILLAGLAKVAAEDPTVQIGHFSHYGAAPSNSIHQTHVWTTAASLAGWYAAGVQLENMVVKPATASTWHRTVGATATYAGLSFELNWVETIPATESGDQ